MGQPQGFGVNTGNNIINCYTPVGTGRLNCFLFTRCHITKQEHLGFYYPLFGAQVTHLYLHLIKG